MAISPLALARNKWFETDEYKRISQGNAQGIYLNNRLELAFIAGWEARDEHLLPTILECAETLDWMLKDMKCKYRWEKNIPEELNDNQVEYSPELTKAIELHTSMTMARG